MSMHSDKNYDGTTTPDKGLVAPKSASRRRLLKGGATVAPVAMTFISMPVRASLGGVTCRSASAFASVAATTNATPNASANATQVCSGATPAGWLSASLAGGKWPNGAAPSALFNDVFGSYSVLVPAAPTKSTTSVASTGIVANTVGSPTFVEVLQGVGTGTKSQERLAKNLVAAYLNNKQGLVPDAVVSVSQLQVMWASVGVGAGNYPVNGINGGWNIVQVNSFLEQTFSI